MVGSQSVGAARLACLAMSLFGLTTQPAMAQSSTSEANAQFTVPAYVQKSAPILPNIMNATAIDAQMVCPGYTASNVQRSPVGFRALLSLAGSPCNVYGNDVDFLNLTVEYQNDARLRVNIRPTYLDNSNYTYYILSNTQVAEPYVDDDAAHTIPNNDLGFFWSNSPTFAFTVVRQSTGDVLFSTMGSKLVYEDQFLEFVTQMPSNYNVYGLSETIHEFRLGNNFTKTFWNADAGNPPDYNIYGTHPFYTDTRYYEVNETTGQMTLFTSDQTDENATYVSKTHTVYNRNAHGQDILLRENNITWRALGGSMDLYFFAGPTVEQATSQYLSSAAGLPVMQQYWTLGYHQSRWGYQNWSVLQEVVDGFANAGIPLECLWTDIDYMNQYRDFDNNAKTFSYEAAAPFFEKLSAAGQHYVPIVDSQIYVPNPNNGSDAYPTYDRGVALNSFLSNPDGTLYLGNVWPGYTAFPDWLEGSGANQWWSGELKTWYDQVNGSFWSGIWIDLSEASSFCLGSCGTGNLSLNPVHPPFSLPGEEFNLVVEYPDGFNLTNATEASSASSVSSSQSAASVARFGTAVPATTTSYVTSTPTPNQRNINFPPYAINNIQGELGAKAVSPNATHHDGTSEYDVHNIWGNGILNATYQGLLNVFPGVRPFIIGRSTFVGAGKFAGHWGGDNYSKFFYMYASISQALQLSLAGIPMFGVDTCGFNYNADYELCSRWMQLSAFFPFYRNHNIITAISQEPYVWSSVTEATKAAMNIRFNLLPYMYTLFYHASTSGATVLRALAWEVPTDPSLARADRQLFLGPAILVTPVLDANMSTVNGVFPGAGKGEIYYDWYTQEDATQVGNVSIDAPLGHIPVYVRGGYILPMQQPAMVTRDARKTPWSVLVALSQEGTAAGDLYLDDGVSVHPNATSYTKLSSTGGMLLASTIGNYSDTNPLANVTVLGLQTAPTQVMLNGNNVTSLSTYNGTSKVLVVNGLQNSTSCGAWTNDWILKWT